MKAVGLITEYNPMHFGHIHHLNESMLKSGADVSIVVMSGNYVQRGEPAIIDKYSRAAAAIDAGVNLVVELPVYYALSSAEDFAKGAVFTLEALKCENVVFGSEYGRIDSLYDIAAILANEPAEYKLHLKDYLSKGLSFPKARENAIKNIAGQDYFDILGNPNNILGIEYIKTIIKYSLNIKPLTIKRIISSYNETEINKDEVVQSATALRAIINKEKDLSLLKAMLPYSMYENIKNGFNISTPVNADDFSLILNYKLSEIFNRNNNNKEQVTKELCSYIDVTNDIANRIYTKFTGTHSFSQFGMLLKSKSYTLSRINRCLMHIIIDITTETKNKFDIQTNVPYVRILGFDKKGQDYLGSIKKSITTPLITKTADYSGLLKEDIYATSVYNQVCCNKFRSDSSLSKEERIKDEFRRGIYIKK